MFSLTKVRNHKLTNSTKKFWKTFSWNYKASSTQKIGPNFSGYSHLKMKNPNFKYSKIWRKFRWFDIEFLSKFNNQHRHIKVIVFYIIKLKNNDQEFPYRPFESFAGIIIYPSVGKYCFPNRDSSRYFSAWASAEIVWDESRFENRTF